MQSSVGPRRESGSASVLPSIAGRGVPDKWYGGPGRGYPVAPACWGDLPIGARAQRPIRACSTPSGGLGRSSARSDDLSAHPIQRLARSWPRRASSVGAPRATVAGRSGTAAQPDLTAPGAGLRQTPPVRSRPSPGSCAMRGGPVAWRMGRAPDRTWVGRAGVSAGERRGRTPAGLRLFRPSASGTSRRCRPGGGGNRLPAADQGPADDQFQIADGVTSMSDQPTYRPETLAIHAGQKPDPDDERAGRPDLSRATYVRDVFDDADHGPPGSSRCRSSGTSTPGS